MPGRISESGSLDLKKLSEDLRYLEESVISVGLSGNEDTELLKYAGAHEFGATIKRGKTTFVLPERSWLRATFEKGSFQERIQSEWKRGLEDLISGSATPDQILMRIGEVAVGQIRSRIINNDPQFKPLKKSTEARKKGPGIMRESLRLLKAISYSINGKWFPVPMGGRA